MALGLIRKGVLQKVASRLLQQIPQQGRGDWDLHEGIRMLEEANDKRRKHRARQKVTYEEVLAQVKAQADKRARKKKPPTDEAGGPAIL